MPNKTHGDVAVFWDLDTCSIHGSNSGYEVVDKIRVLSQQLGTVRIFRGYADLTDLRPPTTLQLRSELQSSGVSLVDCPAVARRSISSKTMIVDMLTHAADNPPPTTFLVIAGNNDLAYAISVLRLRRYDVVLVCPKSRVGQHSQASLYLDWYHDVLGADSTVADDSLHSARDSQRPQPSTSGATETPTTPPDRIKASSTPEQPQEQKPAAGNDPLEPAVRRDPDGPIPLAEIVNDWHEDEDTDTPPPEELVLHSPPATQDAPPFREKDGLEYLRSQSLTPNRVPEIQRPLSAPPSYSSFSPAPSPVSEDICGPPASRPFDPPWYTQEEPFDETVDESSDFHYPTSQPQTPGSTSASTVTPRNGSFAATRVFFPAPISEVTVPPKLPTSMAASALLGLGSLPPSTQPISSTTQTHNVLPPLSSKQAVSVSSKTLPSSPALSSDTVGPPSFQQEPTVPRVQTPSAESSPMPTSTPVPIPSKSISPMTMASPQPPPTRVRPPAPVVVPNHFKALVAKLQECRAQGDVKPFRPGLAAEMVSSHGADLREVGASTFTGYAQAAEQAGIVELPGPGEGMWVALRSEFYDYPAS